VWLQCGEWPDLDGKESDNARLIHDGPVCSDFELERQVRHSRRSAAPALETVSQNLVALDGGAAFRFTEWRRGEFRFRCRPQRIDRHFLGLASNYQLEPVGQ